MGREQGRQQQQQPGAQSQKTVC
ncbi:hypothetical protein CCACVL1_25112 [Corchorus capsularis]|uniref:Uncharacterized protein n=1 Tax=Corchorus capsularis TaxID=210143 RepID=A0A1R3GLY9_COCAP|nr:hypothetical protein CCACVL1_25112 [Corchorus capsularis]